MVPAPTKLPTGVVLLAVVGVVLGAPSVVFGTIDLLSPPEQPSASEAIAELEQRLPEALAGDIQLMRQDPALMLQLDALALASQHIIPAPRLLGAGNLLLSIWCLVAGIGLLKRKEWARKAEIGLLIVGTLFIFGAGYLVIPGILTFAGLLDQTFGPGVIPASASRFLYLSWTALFIVFGGLHGLLVLYMLRPKIRAAFA